MQVLLIEDDPGFTALVRATLDADATVTLRHAPDLESGLAALEEDDFDVVLLDLGLPDSDRRDTLKRLREVDDAVATVIISGGLDAAEELASLRDGAQEVVRKDADLVDLLPRLLEKAVARQQRLAEAHRQQRRERRLREETEASVRWLSELRDATSSASERALGIASPLDSIPDARPVLTEAYGELLDLVVRRAMYRDEPQAGPRVRAFAEQLAELKAGPREVAEIHTLALRHREEHHADPMPELMRSEGRLLLVEVMGYLVTAYRTQALGGRGTTWLSGSPTGTR